MYLELITVYQMLFWVSILFFNFFKLFFKFLELLIKNGYNKAIRRCKYEEVKYFGEVKIFNGC